MVIHISPDVQWETAESTAEKCVIAVGWEKGYEPCQKCEQNCLVWRRKGLEFEDGVGSDELSTVAKDINNINEKRQVSGGQDPAHQEFWNIAVQIHLKDDSLEITLLEMAAQVNVFLGSATEVQGSYCSCEGLHIRILGPQLVML